MATYEDFEWAYAHPYRSLRSLFTPAATDDVPQPKAYVANYMPYLKVATFRDSEVSNEGMFLAIKGGHNRESHNHNDIGNFIVYKAGKPVIIDVGVGKYTRDTFGPNRYTIWTMQSNYHNVAMFDGKGQMQGLNYASRNEVYSAEDKSIAMDIGGAYPQSYGIKEYRRTVKLQGGVVTFTDKIEVDHECEIDMVLMTHREPTVCEGGLLLAEDCVLTYPLGLTYECESVEPTGIDGMARWGSPVVYRLHFKTTAVGGEYTFTINGN